MSAIVSGLIGAVASSILVAIAEHKQRAARVTSNGWRALHASWLLNGMIVGSATLAALPVYSLLSGGSTRPDANEQNIYALLLALVFGAMSGWMTWTAHGRLVMWRGDELRVRTFTGKDIAQRLSDIRSVTRGETLGEYRLSFRDGTKLSFSVYLHGAKEFLTALPETVISD